MTGRPRKLTKNSTGHLTVAVQEKKKNTEDAIFGWDRDQLEEIPEDLRDEVALATWNRLLPDLMTEMSMCNLDRDNLICYCNAWSQYVECIQAMKQYKDDEKWQNEWFRKMLKASAEQRQYGKLCGMDISSRLKYAEAKIKKEDEELEMAFGQF